MKKVYLGIILVIFLVSVVYLGFNNVKSQPQSLQPSNVSMIFTGDVMFGRGVESVINDNIFGDLRSLFLQSDIVVINMESPFTTSNINYKKAIPLKANPNNAHILKDNNVNVVSLANNHIMDYGPQGLKDTITALDKYNINHIGAGDNIEKAVQPAYFNKDNKRIAILNFFDKSTFQGFSETELAQATNNTPGSAPASPEIIKKSIDNAKEKADIVIVTFHYGNEYSFTPNGYQTNISRKCIDDGADLVIGTHPHVPQGIESYKNKLIFYSLGNCVFDQSNPLTKESMIVGLNIINGTPDVEVIPIRIVNSSPKFMNKNNAEIFLKNIQRNSNANINIVDGIGHLNMEL